MKVLLLKSILNLGSVGEVVEVKSGYARNFLFKKKIASAKIFISHEEEKRILLQKEREERISSSLGSKLDKVSDLRIEFVSKCSEDGTLYGSIRMKDVKKSMVLLFRDILSEEEVQFLFSNYRMYIKEIDSEMIKNIGIYTLVIDDGKNSAEMKVVIARTKAELSSI